MSGGVSASLDQIADVDFVKGITADDSFYPEDFASLRWLDFKHGEILAVGMDVAWYVTDASGFTDIADGYFNFALRSKGSTVAVIDDGDEMLISGRRRSVVLLRCGSCMHEVTTAMQNAKLWQGYPCTHG